MWTRDMAGAKDITACVELRRQGKSSRMRSIQPRKTWNRLIKRSLTFPERGATNRAILSANGRNTHDRGREAVAALLGMAPRLTA